MYKQILPLRLRLVFTIEDAHFESWDLCKLKMTIKNCEWSSLFLQQAGLSCATIPALARDTLGYKLEENLAREQS